MRRDIDSGGCSCLLHPLREVIRIDGLAVGKADDEISRPRRLCPTLVVRSESLEEAG